jgi:hypothetical protein
MSMHERFAPSEEVAFSATVPSPSQWFALVGARFATWVKNCADYYAAAAAYEHLCRLSDAELKHRALSRDILARDL